MLITSLLANPKPQHMTLKEWRERYMRYGTPNFVAVTAPTVETNCLPDMCTPVAEGYATAQAQREMQPAQYDGVTLEDMADPGFAASRFAPNKLAAIDAAITYQREFVSNYKRVSSALHQRK